MHIIKKLLSIFETKDHKTLAVLLFLMVVAAFFEMVGIGLIMPIISVMSDPSVIENSKYYGLAYEVLNANSVNDFVIKISAILVGFLIFKNLYLTAIGFYQSYFTARKEAETSTKLLKGYITMPYENYISRNSSDLIRNINQETNQLFMQVLNSMLILIAEAFIALTLFLLLLISYPAATIASTALAGFAAFVFIYFVKKPLKTLGEERIESRARMLEWATQGLHGLKELVVAEKTNYFVEAFGKKAHTTAKAQGFSEAMARIPRLYIETVAVLMLVAVILVITKTEDNMIQALSLFGMVMFRILPSINRIATCATRIRFYGPALNAIVADLKHEHFDATSSESITFKKSLEVKDVHYKYPDSDRPILNGISLTIQKGESISIKGPSGAGKSTLLDMMLGLLEPVKGSVQSDGVSIHKNIKDWRSHLSYLPQFVYLINDSIRANVAFGVNEADIDDKKVMDVLKKAELTDLIQSLPEGIESKIGDVSGKLSGGQRQRIGIARALYHDRDILFLDEATASLDHETEMRICKTLKSLAPEVTLISVSHRQALLDIADNVYTIENGKIVS